MSSSHYKLWLHHLESAVLFLFIFRFLCLFSALCHTHRNICRTKSTCTVLGEHEKKQTFTRRNIDNAFQVTTPIARRAKWRRWQIYEASKTFTFCSAQMCIHEMSDEFFFSVLLVGAHVASGQRNDRMRKWSGYPLDQYRGAMCQISHCVRPS